VTKDQVTAFIERHADAWNRRSPDALCLDHAEAGVVVSPMFGRVQGRAHICSSYASLFAVFPDWEIRFETAIVDESRVAVPFSVNATHVGDFLGLPGTGRRCSFTGASLYELDGDMLIREERRVYDFTGLLAQLGVLRVKPAR
jgi:steroid delta-isomerase-like uncharacterized protein